MEQLPEWWDELVAWFQRARPKMLSPSMAHAWRVNRYADRVCNAGFADYLDTNGRDTQLVLESLRMVSGVSHVHLLGEAIAFRAQARSKRRLPRDALVPKAVAYDCLFRGWSNQKTEELLAELFPKCSSKLYPAILEVAADEVAALAGWERLGARFYRGEPKLRLDIARYSRDHLSEWRENA